MKKIYAKVVADLMHPGHVEFFRKARELGDHLTVNVVPDARVSLTKRKPIMSTDERVQLVGACRYVDEVIIDGPKIITLEFMVEKGFDIYAFGANDDEELRKKLADCSDVPAAMKVQIEYMNGISSTEIIARILRQVSMSSINGSAS